MNNLVEMLYKSLVDKEIQYQPIAHGPMLTGTVTGLSSRNVIIKGADGIAISAPFDKVFIDAPCIIIPSSLKS